jgi:protein TonB
MFATLLESRGHKERSVKGGIASISAHAAVIALAVIATARANPGPSDPREVIRIAAFVPQQAATPVKTVAVEVRRVPAPTVPPIDMKRLDVNLPPIDLSAASVSVTDFPVHANGNTGIVASGTSEGSGSVAAFEAVQVEKQASFIAGSATPRYPDELRRSGIEGKVVARFVVDENGRAEADSVRFLSSDNRLFDDAVKATLRRMRFVPAEIGGRKVRQLVEMPFVFTIGR